MAKLMNMVLSLAIVTNAQALALINKQGPPYYIVGDHVIEMTHYDSKPGSPIIQDWEKTPLFVGGQEWRGIFGERLVKALVAGDVMTFCKRLVSIDEYSWCRHAMPIESKDHQLKTGLFEHEYVLPRIRVPEKFANPQPDSMLGLSYGVSNPDTWSEIMSNKYGVKTKLFDCGSKFPQDLHSDHSMENLCTTRSCYDTEYTVEDICLDDSAGNHEKFIAKNNKTFQPLSVALQGQEDYSTLLKLDVDGAEWATLDWILQQGEAVTKKIRTLDVRMHITKDASPDGIVNADTKEAMTHHVEIVENLTMYFSVVGSSVEGDLKLFKSNLDDHYDKKKPPKIQEPPIHTQGGLPLEEFSVSYLNRRLL